MPEILPTATGGATIVTEPGATPVIVKPVTPVTPVVTDEKEKTDIFHGAVEFLLRHIVRFGDGEASPAAQRHLESVLSTKKPEPAEVKEEPAPSPPAKHAEPVMVDGKTLDGKTPPAGPILGTVTPAPGTPLGSGSLPARPPFPLPPAK
jgi:hypothetical protein